MMARSPLVRSLVAALALAMATQAARAQGNAALLDVSDLPLIEARSSTPTGGVLAVFISGDGGWAHVDRGVTAELNASGVDVVGLDSRAYLRQEKTPDRSAADIARIARAYMARWNDARIVLVGYSRGADMMPFVVNRLPADLRARTATVALLGLAPTVNFHFHWQDIVRDVRRSDDRPTGPELAKLRASLPSTTRMVCVYGSDEKISGCRDLGPAAGVSPFGRPGGHDMGGDMRPVGAVVVGAIGRPT